MDPEPIAFGGTSESRCRSGESDGYCASSEKRPRLRAVASHVRPGEKVHPDSAYVGTKAYACIQKAKPEEQVLQMFLADDILEGGDDEDSYVSYILDDFVIYRTPEITPVGEEAVEDEKLLPSKLLERGPKGQGEYELPSAVYLSYGVKSLVFDGVLKSGQKWETLYRIPFETLAIGNLATPSAHNIDNSIWIQSHLGAKLSVEGGVWYELGRPAKEYRKHWHAFRWLALLVKYVSDAIEIHVQRHHKINLNYFRADFAKEMKHIHGSDTIFRHWIHEFGKQDFRIAMATYSEFLWSQLHSAASTDRQLMKHLDQPFWGEILPWGLDAIRPAHHPARARERCVVTPYVGDLFSWVFGDGLQVVEASCDIHGFKDEYDNVDNTYYRALSVKPQVLGPYTFHHAEYSTAVYPRFTTRTTGAVRPGDVIELKRDEITRWKRSTQKWYAFVTDRYKAPKSGLDRLRIIWLYWPEDVALCMSMKYPYSNELFFSDHCECEKSISPDDVVRKVAIEFFCIDGIVRDPSSRPNYVTDIDAELFIRQKYFSVSDNTHIETLTPRDIAQGMTCPCQDDKQLPIYVPGEFVLVADRYRLQPYVFEAYQGELCSLRKLERRREVDGEGKMNELLWTEEIVNISVQKIVRKCKVVKVEVDEDIPRLADWGGSSDWFFYRAAVKSEGSRLLKSIKETSFQGQGIETHQPNITNKPQQMEIGICVPFDCSTASTEPQPYFSSIVESENNPVLPARASVEEPNTLFSVTKHVSELRKMRSLDLFCGGGNFGRGVADGGVVRPVWAVDIDTHAIHSYKANLEEEDVNLYLGSMNNFLFDVITRRRRDLPKQGDIDVILSGSPCQGFSVANPHGPEALKSLRNSALVCTAISAIDYYRPKYAILENVPAMASDRKYNGQTVNVSNQIMCALIGMGYQCRCLLLDAWHFGAPQSRTRLFIEIAAPGCVLPEIPAGSHTHPSEVVSRAVGKTAANIRFAERDLDSLTSFPPVKLHEMWADLPKIGNGHIGVCIPYPDHKTYYVANALHRKLTAYIPLSDMICRSSDSRNPSYRYALRRQLIPQDLQLRQIPNPNQDARFTRLNAELLPPTVTCQLTPQSRVSGKTLHYSEDRVISILEAKRLQGFLDTDVLIGKPSKTFKIIGNSVCRQVAFALGEKLAEAVKKNPTGSRKGENCFVDSVKLKENCASRNFMVLIVRKGVKRPLHDTELGDSISKDISRGDVRFDMAVGRRVDRVQVVVTSKRTKRIRIEVEV